MTETFYATQQVRALTGQGWPPAGIECCVVRGRPRLRSVHRERAGRVMEPREKSMRSRRRYVDGRPPRRSRSGLGSAVRRGLRAGHVRTGRPETWEVFSTAERRRGRLGRSGPGSRGTVCPRGSEGGRSGGSAERRKRTAIRLLVLTGCRRNEILGPRWEDLDFKGGEMRLSDSKTGARVVPMPPPAAKMLADPPRVPGNPWVFPGRKKDTHTPAKPQRLLGLRSQARRSRWSPSA